MKELVYQQNFCFPLNNSLRDTALLGEQHPQCSNIRLDMGLTWGILRKEDDSATWHEAEVAIMCIHVFWSPTVQSVPTKTLEHDVYYLTSIQEPRLLLQPHVCTYNGYVQDSSTSWMRLNHYGTELTFSRFLVRQQEWIYWQIEK